MPAWWMVWALTTASVAVLCCGLAIWRQVVDGDATYTLVAGVGLVLAGLSWLFCTLSGMFLRRRGNLLSLVAPAMVLVAWALLWSGAPERLGWWLSEGSMTSAAAECVPTNDQARYGVYTITRVDRYSGGCLFHNRSSLIGTAGFGHFEHPPPAPSPGDSVAYRFTHFDGDWYRFIR